MKPFVSAISCWLFLFSVSLASDAGQKPAGRISSYGLMKVASDPTQVKNPNAPSGKEFQVRPAEVTFTEQTDTVSARINTVFGFQYTLSDLPPNARVKVRQVVKHPLIKFPHGKASRGYVTNFELEVTAQGTADRGIGYLFEEEHELVPGKWTFEIWYEGKKLVGKTFTVVSPRRSSIP